jgi:hypothetical protein
LAALPFSAEEAAMRVMELVNFVRRRRATALALLVPLTLSAAPASAQDLFGFLRLFSSPIAREPVYQPYELRALPEFERRTIRRRPKVVRAEPPKIPIKPKVPGEVTNPVPELLADSTLRRGDIVMFPEGPKVFNGQPGRQHALTDFVPVARAGSVVPQSTRKVLASLRPDWNAAWSTERSTAGGKLAENTRDFETTGGVNRKRSRGGD